MQTIEPKPRIDMQSTRHSSGFPDARRVNEKLVPQKKSEHVVGPGGRYQFFTTNCCMTGWLL
jgi:hypothetical protein